MKNYRTKPDKYVNWVVQEQKSFLCFTWWSTLGEYLRTFVPAPRQFIPTTYISEEDAEYARMQLRFKEDREAGLTQPFPTPAKPWIHDPAIHSAKNIS